MILVLGFTYKVTVCDIAAKEKTQRHELLKCDEKSCCVT